MRGTSDEIWGKNTDPHSVMRAMTENSVDDQEGPTYWLRMILLEHEKVFIVFFFYFD
jgi:hypothetical protein